VSVFLRNFGLSDSQIGVVLSIPTAVSLFSTVYGGVYADTVANGKLWTMLVANVASSVAFQFLLLASLFNQSAKLRLVYISIIIALNRSARSPTGPVLDAYTLEFLEKEGVAGNARASKARRGRERMWGAVSWGITSIALGICLDRVGFSVVYAFNAVTTAVLVAVLVRGMGVRNIFARFGAETAGFQTVDYSEDANEMSDVSSVEADDSAQSRGGALDFFHVLMRDIRSVIFLFTVACLGAGVSMVESLVFLFFVKDIGASNFLCGLSVVVTVAFEIPLFWVGDSIMRSMSATAMMLVAMLCYFTRVAFYTIVPREHAWLVLLVEPLHGLTYSLSNMATVSTMSDMAPPHLQATGQSFLSVAEKLGRLGGTLFGSYIMQRYGSVIAYRGFAMLVACSAVLFGTTALFSRKPQYQHGDNDVCQPMLSTGDVESVPVYRLDDSDVEASPSA
jgi:MFS_1 like family